VLPLYIESLGIDIVGWSLLATSFAVGMFFLEWVWGFLSDRMDRRLLMVISVLVMSSLFPLYTFRGLVPFFIILQFLSGAVGVIIGPTTRAYMSDESPKKRIGLFASLWWASHTTGRIIGPLLGAYVAQTWSFEYAFYLSTILSLLLVPVILLTFPKHRKPVSEKGQRILGGVKTVLRFRPASYLFLSAVFSFIGLTAVRSFLPLFASEQMNMSTVEIGILISATSLSQLIAMPLLGWLSDRFGRKRAALSGFLFSSAVFMFYLLVKTSSQLLLVSMMVSVGLAASSLLLALVPDVAPRTLYGTTVGLYGSSEDLGIIIGPLLYGLVWSAFGPVFIFVASAFTQVVGALLVLAIRARRSVP
jgi:MFS family permease